MTGRLSVRYSALDSDIITMDPQNDSKPTKGWKIGYFLSGLRRRHFAIYGTGFVCLVAVIFAVTFSVLLRRSGNQPVADLGYARYRGVAGSNGVSQWLGVRYAAAPVGDLRFAEPHDPPATNDTQDATKVIHFPIQFVVLAFDRYPRSISDDVCQSKRFGHSSAPPAFQSGNTQFRLVRMKTASSSISLRQPPLLPVRSCRCTSSSKAVGFHPYRIPN